MAAGDYPSWVFDPSGVNPPMLVVKDADYVALLNSPVPTNAPTTAPNVPVVVAPVVPLLTQIGGITVSPPGAKFLRAPRVGTVPMPLVVNATPHVAGKR